MNPSKITKWDREHNCGSYALGVNFWVSPYDEYREDRIKDICNLLNNEYLSIKEVEDIVLNEDSDYLCRKFNLEEISSNKIMVLAPSIELIAYRIFLKTFYSTYNRFRTRVIDYDFHFRVRRNGIWSEKCGQWPIEDNIDMNGEVWDCEPFIYDSKIKYFIKKTA